MTTDYWSAVISNCSTANINSDCVPTSSVWAVSDDREEVLQNVTVVGLVEALSSRVLLGHILQHGVQYTEPNVGHIAHGVLESPDHRVQDQLELSRGDVEESCNTKHHVTDQVKAYPKQNTNCTNITYSTTQKLALSWHQNHQGYTEIHHDCGTVTFHFPCVQTGTEGRTSLPIVGSSHQIEVKTWID